MWSRLFRMDVDGWLIGRKYFWWMMLHVIWRNAFAAFTWNRCHWTMRASYSTLARVGTIIGFSGAYWMVIGFMFMPSSSSISPRASSEGWPTKMSVMDWRCWDTKSHKQKDMSSGIMEISFPISYTASRTPILIFFYFHNFCDLVLPLPCAGKYPRFVRIFAAFHGQVHWNSSVSSETILFFARTAVQYAVFGLTIWITLFSFTFPSIYDKYYQVNIIKKRT